MVVAASVGGKLLISVGMRELPADVGIVAEDVPTGSTELGTVEDASVGRTLVGLLDEALVDAIVVWAVVGVVGGGVVVGTVGNVSKKVK